ncbi:hypothetical protein EJ06DRAFT_133159 [Trichodelitschia bisporula]|uniref:Uncharacterized protein n=1 Tax=Trichodelitschia bisporula TaxID=703511 RepID=A0A6G1HP66_9PEZI|nr:hypothetical protein EJ06DRAFT_133159 [Trichodelitschia bisporula]
MSRSITARSYHHSEELPPRYGVFAAVKAPLICTGIVLADCLFACFAVSGYVCRVRAPAGSETTTKPGVYNPQMHPIPYQIHLCVELSPQHGGIAAAQAPLIAPELCSPTNSFTSSRRAGSYCGTVQHARVGWVHGPSKVPSRPAEISCRPSLSPLPNQKAETIEWEGRDDFCEAI